MVTLAEQVSITTPKINKEKYTIKQVYLDTTLIGRLDLKDEKRYKPTLTLEDLENSPMPLTYVKTEDLQVFLNWQEFVEKTYND